MPVLARVPVIVVALLIAGASLTMPLRTLAQDEATTEETPTLTATPTPDAQEITVVVTNDATSTPLDPAMVLVLVLVLLLVALFALAEIFRYLRDGREDYYKTFREFARRGVYVEPVMVNATAAQAPAALERADGSVQESAEAPKLFRVRGPGLIVAGSTETFQAFLNDQAAQGTLWALTASDGSPVPAESATLTPAAGAVTTFAAAKPGTYILTATPDAAQGLSVQVQTTIAVVEPPTGEGAFPKLPFIGEGYGSIVGAILLLAVVVVLAATRAIDADIIGVLLGSIAGYLFGVGVSKTTS